MARNDTSPVNTSATLIKEGGTITPYFKGFLDTLWRRTGGFVDASDTLNNIASLNYVVQTASAYLTGEKVATNTARIAWDFSVADQAKLDLIAASVAYAYIQNVSATDRILGRQSPGAGTIEEIICTAAGRALLDDANAAAQLVTLGAMAATTTLDAIPTAVASVDFDQQQAVSFVVENRTSDPGSPVVGQLWIRTDLI